jgi:hypothetical protein
MGRKKGKNKKYSRRQHGHALSGVSQVMDHPVAQTVTKGGLVLLTAIAAGGAGAALGKHSLIAGIPLALFGYHKSNQYLMAAGMGLVLSNGFQNPNKTTAVQGVDGLDLKLVAEEAKDRVGTFFKNFSEKLYLTSAEPTPTAGLSGNGKDDQVTYFVNPYNNAKELDMSAIDRLQEQIASMSKAGTNGLSAVEEPDREF